MNLIDTLFLALRMFQTRRTRTLLTILGVSVGIGTVHLLVSLGHGLQQAVLERIASADALLSLDVGPSPLHPLAPDAIHEVQRLPHVREVARMIKVPGQFVLGKITAEASLLFVDPAYPRDEGADVLRGKALTGNPAEAVLSAAALRLVGRPPDGVLGQGLVAQAMLPAGGADGGGTERALWSGSYVIAGIAGNENQSLLYLPLASHPGLALRDADRIKVKVDEARSLPGVREALIAAGFQVASVSDVIGQAQQVFGALQLGLGLFGLVALFIAAIGMFNTMTVTLLERTQEIGIMRAIGMSRRDVRAMFVIESMLMGWLGGIAGIALSFLAGTVLNAGLNAVAARFGGSPVALFVSPWWYTSAVAACSALIGLATGLFPARRAARLNPLDALRYK